MDNFKGVNGVMLTQGLFLEHNNKDAPYTLRDYDIERKGKVYKSVPAIYRTCVDEYDAAMQIVGSWEHWKKLSNIDWFLNGLLTSQGYRYTGLVDWRYEMQMRDESTAKRQLLEQAEGGNMSASRYLHEAAKKSTSKAGRPQKPTKQKETSSTVTQIYNRLKK